MAAIGGVIASAVGKYIGKKLGDLVQEEITLLWGFRDDVEGMEDKMKDLEAVMHDADERMCRGERDGVAVGKWLMKFKSIAYDVEDVLDELDATELIEKTQSKLKLFFSRNNQLFQRITIAHDMKNVRKKIEKVEKEGRRTLKLENRGPRAEGSRNNETFAAISEGMKTRMVGRDTEKEKMISLLLKSDAEEEISIIPIVGLGGVGKSTLAESVLADKRINVFDIQVWVHVSEKFDMYKIGCAIVKTINSSINLDNCTLQFLHDVMKKELATTRYLIVLDDLWEEDGNKLEDLKRVLQYGCKGSRIVVTARNQRVVQILNTGFLATKKRICPVPESEQINLGVLSDNECWEVMKQRAFGPNGDDQSGLEEVGRQIAAKCGGLPLVANALGQVMFDSRTVEAWENIRDTKMDLDLREVHQSEALERLMLSYYYMRLEFKMCFTYLASFPKGFIMGSDHLIQQWIALGYIHETNGGQRCINYLLGMSFLQIPRSSLVSRGPVHARAPWELIMHDMVHDLASTITVHEFRVLDANAPEPRAWNRAPYCRHAQLINYKNQPKIFKDLPTMVRSLHFRYSDQLQLPQKAFGRCKYIRVLELSGCSVGGESNPSNSETEACSAQEQSTSRNITLPSSIHRSKLLRYLDATAIPITSLPKSFHTLHYMQTLIMSKCSLETLPENICSLHELSHLDLSGNVGLNKLPSSLGELSKLSFLNLFGCSALQELPESVCDLTWLEYLDMSRCPAIQTLPDQFGSLPKLIFLNMSGCLKLTKLPDNVTLQSLEHLNLSGCHELKNLPRDFGNLKRLEFLSLSDCYKVLVLPESFCQLTHLKDLDLSDCHGLKELPDYFGDLSNLESLNLCSCSKLQLLPASLCKMLNLRVLNMSYCTNLQKLPSLLGDLKLHILDIRSTMALTGLPDRIDTMTSLTQFEVMTGNSTVSGMADAIKKNLKLPTRRVHIVQQIESKRCSSIVELVQSSCPELEVVKLQNVKDPEDAERAKLRDKSYLRLLSLKWGYVEEDIAVIGYEAFLSSFIHDQRPHGEEDKPVLERLIPPRTLEQFLLQGYLSNDFPNWMSDISSYLPSLTFLGICGLGGCDTLPPFGQLPNLRSLYLGDSPKIRKIGREVYGESGTCTKLRIISLSSMKNLEEWWTTRSGGENEEFLIPNLHSLAIIACPKLKFLPYPPRSHHWELNKSDEVLPEGGFGELRYSVDPFEMVIRSCNFSPNKWRGLQHFTTLEILTVQSCSNSRALLDVMQFLTSLTALHLMSLHELRALPGCLGQLTSLKTVLIMDCPNLISLPESMKKLSALRKLCMKGTGLQILPEWIGQLISLQNLEIGDFSNLTSLPEIMKNLTALKIFIVESCSGLRLLPECLGHLTSLEEISINVCPNLISLPVSMKNLSALKILSLNSCPGIDVLPEWLGELTSLQELSIILCPNLPSLPESIRNLTVLKKLHIEGCPILSERCQREDVHKISHIPEVALPEMTAEMYLQVYMMSHLRRLIGRSNR